MPLSSSPRKGTGGNVIGTRWMMLGMCRSPSSFQKAWLFWSSLIVGFPSGIMYLPMFSTFSALRMSVLDSSGL